MKRSSLSLVFNIFLAAGMLMLIITGVICYNIQRFDATAAKTTGKVVDLIEKRVSSGNSRSYSPVVMFSDSSHVVHRYIPNASSNPPGYSIGEIVEMHYDLKNPDDAQIAGWSEYIGAMVTGGLGLIFGLIGIVYHVVRKFNQSRNAQLKQSGQLVLANFIAVDVNNAISVNNRNPYFIRCEWKDPQTGKSHLFKSGSIWNDPTRFIDPDKKIEVYMDANNPRKYHVELPPYGED